MNVEHMQVRLLLPCSFRDKCRCSLAMFEMMLSSSSSSSSPSVVNVYSQQRDVAIIVIRIIKPSPIQTPLTTYAQIGRPTASTAAESSLQLTATMKLLTSILAALSLTAPALAAKRSASSGDVYPTYHKQALASGSIALDDASFNVLTAMPRNHSTLVVLTALEARFGCKMCQEFKPEWDILAKSWMNGDRNGESRLLFGELDFERGRSTFEKVGQFESHVLEVFD